VKCGVARAKVKKAINGNVLTYKACKFHIIVQFGKRISHFTIRK